MGVHARPSADDLLEEVRAGAREIEGLDEAPSRFGGALAWRRGGREVGHVHPRGSEGEADLEGPALWLDVRLPREAQGGLRGDVRLVPRRGRSAWVEVRVACRADVAFAVGLLRAAR